MNTVPNEQSAREVFVGIARAQHSTPGKYQLLILTASKVGENVIIESTPAKEPDGLVHSFEMRANPGQIVAVNGYVLATLEPIRNNTTDLRFVATPWARKTLISSLG